MRIAVLSDIHGNLTAIQAVISDLNKKNIDGCIFLGDLIDYGPHSNEVIQILSGFKWPIYCNIWGNHEEAIINQDFSRFSSERGWKSARFTQQNLTVQSKIFIKTNMQSLGFHKFMIDGKKLTVFRDNQDTGKEETEEFDIGAVKLSGLPAGYFDSKSAAPATERP